jgi:hypothetical protein
VSSVVLLGGHASGGTVALMHIAGWFGAWCMVYICELCSARVYKEDLHDMLRVWYGKLQKGGLNPNHHRMVGPT